MELSAITTVLLGLMLAAWTFAAAMAILSARDHARRASAARGAARRLARMIEHSPALPLLIKGDGALEGSERLAAWLGLDVLPLYLDELGGKGGEGGLPAEQLETLRSEVRRTLKTAAPFRMMVTPCGSRCTIELHAQRAERQVAPDGATLVWWTDASGTAVEAARLREDLAAFAGLFDAVPVPLWLRGPDGALTMVNRAYVEAVRAPEAQIVLDSQTELVSRGHHGAGERIVQAMTGGGLGNLAVREMPLEGGGAAGFALPVGLAAGAHETQGRAADTAMHRNANGAGDGASVAAGAAPRNGGSALLPLLAATLRAREAAVEAKGLTVNLSGSRRLMTRRANRGELERALGALFDEVIAKAVRGGTIDVELGRDRDSVRIGIVADTGDGPEHPATKDARAIFEAQGGRLAVHRTPAGRRVFAVTLR